MATREEKPKKEKTGNETKLPIVLIIIIAVLAIGGSLGGTLIANKFLSNKDDSKKAETAVSTSKISKDEAIVAMDEFLVNLAKGSSGDQQYIRVKVSLLTESEATSKELTKNIAVARDSVVNILRQKKAEDILSSAESVTNLKKQLKDAINKEYGTPIVKDVFVTDLVIQ